MCCTVRLLVFIVSLSLTGIAWAAAQVSTQVTGISGEIQKNVNLALQNEKGSLGFYQKTGSKLIKKAMQPYGYFHPRIQFRRLRQKNQWIAAFNITPGPPVRITDVSVGIVGPAKNDQAFKRLYAHLPLKVGDVLNTENYEKTKQLLYDLASTRGYFDSKMLQNKIYINLKTNEARIYIKFESGPRYFFGNTLFSQTPFSPSFLMRFLRYKKGKPYNYHKITRTQQDFIDSNYFSQVIINPAVKNRKSQHVPIQVKLIPRKRFAYTLGAGYGTDTGPRATIGFGVRRINKFGHQIKTIIQASQKNSYASATYFIPGRHPASDVWALNTGFADFNQNNGQGKSLKLEGSYTTSLGQWKQTVALTYLKERYSIVDFPFTETQLLYPNINWQYISTHEKLHPKNGFSVSGFLGGTPKIAPSKTSFFQARINAKILFTLFDSTRFLLRSSIARTQVKKIQNIPYSLQLFVGGARSVRGYSYNEIGPGRNLFIGSAEIQQRIKGNWYLVGLFDAGNVSDNNPFKKLNEGVGTGIAWLSPVGVLEITITNAITKPNKPWVIQFTMGPEL